jgi:ubiquitin-conjugating enzyme E2 O
MDHDLAVPRLSGGGIITLQRTLSKLRNILDSHSGESISY